MRKLRVLVGYEFLQCFVSPFFYAICSLFILLTGLIFFFSLKVYADFSQDEPFIQTLFKCFWLPSLLIVPVLTTRSIASERSSQRLDSMLALHMNPLWIVLSKFITIYSIYMGLWIVCCAFPWMAQRLCPGLRPFANILVDSQTLYGGLLYLFLVNGLVIAFGLFCSSVAKYPITAIVSTAVGIFIFLISGQLFKYLSVASLEHGEFFGTAYGEWNTFFHLEDFCRCIIDTRVVVGYGSLTCAFLLLAALTLHHRS